MFNFGFNKKMFVIILLVLLALQVMSAGTAGILNLLLIVPGVLIAITFHEFAHAYAAYKLGDQTAKMQGRLNLNPLSHIDLFGFVFLIIAGFGWGKPVQINPRNFNSKYSISKAEAIVSAAGPIINFILAFVFMLGIYLINIFWPAATAEFYQYLYGLVPLTSLSWAGLTYIIVYYAISINIGLAVFNLIPLPPLDGSKILMHFLPAKGKQWFYKNEQMFYILFLVIWITGLSAMILEPIFGIVFNGLSFVVGKLVGLFI